MWRRNYKAQNRIEYVSALQTTISSHRPDTKQVITGIISTPSLARAAAPPHTQRKREGGEGTTRPIPGKVKNFFFRYASSFSLIVLSFASEIKTRNETTSYTVEYGDGNDRGDGMIVQPTPPPPLYLQIKARYAAARRCNARLRAILS